MVIPGSYSQVPVERYLPRRTFAKEYNSRDTITIPGIGLFCFSAEWPTGFSWSQSLTQTIIQHEEGVDLIPANIELSALEINLVNAMSREVMLRSIVEYLKAEYDYKYIIIDCISLSSSLLEPQLSVFSFWW